MSTASILKAVRLTHLYLGVFVAPAILFFAFTGAIQTFSLHEPGKGGPYKPTADYKPSQWEVILAQIHKNQTPIVNAPRPKPAADAAAKPVKHDDAPAISKITVTPAMPATAVKQHNPMPLKYFFLLVSISLFISTFTGIYMAWKFSRNKVAIASLLVLGTVIPVLMVVL